MKLKLILPKCYDRKEDKGDKYSLPPLQLPTIAALTPPHVQVQIVDDRHERIDYDGEVDLVGITCMTETAGRAYDIADEFRRRGIPVILGGLHATLMPGEALQHADSVFCGEVYGVWESVIRDCERGQLKRIYRNLQPPDLSNILPPRLDLLPKHRRYFLMGRLINATRGCYQRCTFCSTKEFWNGTMRFRPVQEVVDEIRRSGKKFQIFVDDDIGGNKKYARELFQALKPLKIFWASQTRISLCLDKSLIALAGESGCFALFTGFESISPETLKEMQKWQNLGKEYEEAIDNCHRNGICLEAGIVFGFDSDDRGTFERTLEFILKSKLDSVNVNILHPIPGTPIFEQLEQEGRILTHDWNAWAAHDRCLFRPKQMSVDDVEAGAAWVLKETYRWPRIIRRMVRSFRWRWWHPYFLLRQNLSYKRRRADQWGGGYNPADGVPLHPRYIRELSRDRSEQSQLVAKA